MLVAGVLALAGSGAGRAETLVDALDGARGRDPAVIGARAQADATRERIGVVRAAGAPTLGVGGTANAQYAEVNGGSPRQIEGGSGALNLNVPLYRPQVDAAVEQAGVASRSAGVQVDAAEQDLLLRTSVAYLEVLTAIETLQTIGAQKAALVLQLASARRSFDVGTATIVDPNEAQARLDASGLKVAGLRAVELAGVLVAVRHLERCVAVALCRTDLHDPDRGDAQDSDRDDDVVVGPDLGHAQLLSY